MEHMDVRALKLEQIISVASVAVALSGCVSEARYRAAPDGASEYGSGSGPVNSSRFEVRSDKYPFYAVESVLMPPEAEYCSKLRCAEVPQVPILPSDKWKVTHVFRGRYLIQSDEYNERQCRLLASEGGYGGYSQLGRFCSPRHFFAIYISPEGSVSGGWELFRAVGGWGRKEMYMNPHPSKNIGWPAGRVFRLERVEKGTE